MITSGTPKYGFYGLSTDDPKPTEGVQNGTSFFEMDTGKHYLFDEENQEWLEYPLN